MINCSLHTSGTTAEASINDGTSRWHQATSVPERRRVGRFDDGIAIYPDAVRGHVGRFDDGSAPRRDRIRERVVSIDSAHHPHRALGADEALAA